MVIYLYDKEVEMSKSKLCCFTVNTTHACIIANNYITNNLENVKIIYINERGESKKVKNIVSRFYNKIEDRMYYSEWLNENLLNDYEHEEFVFVIHGKEKFISNVNKFLDINRFNGYVINCYDICEIKSKVEDVIARHDYYMNTTGIVSSFDYTNGYNENKRKMS